MIKLLSDLPDDVVGIEAVGRIETSDYETVLDPAVEAALQGHEKIRLLYVLGEEFEGYSAGASWEDLKLGVEHWSKWERIAVVTDKGWIRDGVRMFGWMLPGAVKVFETGAREEAIAWVTGR
jgi:hypothetical protein